MSWFWAQRGAFARCINLLYARMSWLHSKAEIWVVNNFYRSLGCPQLTSSSCDVRVHFGVAMQCYFKCKCCGTLSCFIQKCVLHWLFTVKTLLYPKICVHLWKIHVTLRQTNNELVLSLPIDVIKDWFQLHPSIRCRTPEWIKTKIMQIKWLWNTLLS